MPLKIWTGLLASAFLSSTVLPGSSEAYTIYLVRSHYPVMLVFLIASAGNILGSLVNYWIGRGGYRLLKNRIWGFSKKNLARSRLLFRKYGAIALFFAFLPVIGDPVTGVAGLMRYPLKKFLVVVAAGKLFRYAFVIWLFYPVGK
ncbi:MAG: DedA family protein [Leptospiraceae bacterium]|nr:DedA family protein [Leptospiraceae bacterium]